MIQDTIDQLFWKASSRNPQPLMKGLGAKPGFKPTGTRLAARADETTRMVREIIDTAAWQWQASIAVLRAASFRKQAKDGPP